ncbi:hypothetical protein HQQ80_14480 [Microbacteriaceae bacterium VKM Ac-2855]|nr:hypothetical protein [Microbacteriaceae bacterium VKM Ac-2855]
MSRALPTRRALRILRAAHPNIRRDALLSVNLDDEGLVERVSYRGIRGGVAFLVDHGTGDLFEVPAGRSSAMNLRSIRDRALRPVARVGSSRPRRTAWFPRRPNSAPAA